jgi:hypothetical protein
MDAQKKESDTPQTPYSYFIPIEIIWPDTINGFIIYDLAPHGPRIKVPVQVRIPVQDCV